MPKNTSSILTIFLFSLFISTACNKQISQDKLPASKLTTTSAIKDTLKINQYKAEKKEGLWRTYHVNGQLKAEGDYKEGLKEGLHKEWEADGVLTLEGFYVKGKANGLMKWYHGLNHLAGSGNMKDDIRVGPWTICDVSDNGFCIAAYFKDGKREGIWKINHEGARDKLWKEQTWQDDKLVGERCWDENGQAIDCR